MLSELDKLDKQIHQTIEENPGCSVRDAIREHFLERSESVLRDRVRALELRQLIRTEKTKREVRCYPVAEVVK